MKEPPIFDASNGKDFFYNRFVEHLIHCPLQLSD